jgi:CRISPR-associated exonuclease Cas4
VKVIELIEKGVNLIESNKDKKIGVYYPSEASKCVRQNYYSYFEKPHYDIETHKAFSIGNALHALAQNALHLSENEFLKIDNEVPNLVYFDKENGFEIHGRLDSMIKDKRTGKIDIIEIKTIANIKYAPLKDHFEQLNYYLHFYPDAEGHLLYINKSKRSKFDDSFITFKEVPNENQEKITYNDELFQQTLKRVRILHHYLISKKLPYPEGKMSSDMYWQCDFCPYRAKCDREENERIIDKKEYGEIAKKYEKVEKNEERI